MLPALRDAMLAECNDVQKMLAQTRGRNRDGQLHRAGYPCSGLTMPKRIQRQRGKSRDIADVMEQAAKQPPRPCDYCGASVDMLPERAFRAMRGCNNCQADITCRGQWSGIGYRILLELAKRHGVRAIELAWEATDRPRATGERGEK